MQPAQWVLIFLVLVGNSALFQFLRSYTFLLIDKSPFLCALGVHVYALLSNISIHEERRKSICFIVKKEPSLDLR